ncbi:baseplate J/gp47 family protein [uncultured Desulfovibrio sp.]|uniref:baseplate assembly protein n=1 Tax=uncultured Desulfovibrio sp. TaxID=167968 RepID=UPI00259178A8|nr:baseplate J/gp47 family protein [uncultured Desulfovibrio sp.]
MTTSGSVNLAVLPDVSFAESDASAVEAAVLTVYEGLTGLTLQPGDPVRLFLESLAYTVSVQNQLIDLAGKQNLLAYARGAHLDHLGALMGEARIAAQSARVMLRFELTEPLAFAVPIPVGSRASTKDGNILFATAIEAEIPAGQTGVEVPAHCTSPGASGTGLVPGQITQLVDPLPYVAGVSNVTISSEGSDIEDDERLRERIRLAPESYTVAGSTGAYEARVLGVSADILAVAVDSPEPGVVDVRFVLTDGELPDAAMIALVSDSLSAETVRPLTDKVLVGAPDVVEYAVTGRWYALRADAALLSGVARAVERAVETYRIWQRSQPGRDINPSRLIALVQQAGAKRVELDAPLFTPLTATQVARETAVSLVFGGLEEE